MIMKKLKRVSRWITIQVFPITKRHRLWLYAEPSDMGQPDGEQLISAFRFRNRWYAVNQFIVALLAEGVGRNPGAPRYLKRWRPVALLAEGVGRNVAFAKLY